MDFQNLNSKKRLKSEVYLKPSKALHTRIPHFLLRLHPILPIGILNTKQEIPQAKRKTLSVIRRTWGLLMCQFFRPNPGVRIRVFGDKEPACVHAPPEIHRSLRFENHLPRLSSRLPLPKQHRNCCIILERHIHQL